MNTLPQPYDGHSEAYHSWRKKRLDLQQTSAPALFHLIHIESESSSQSAIPVDELALSPAFTRTLCDEVLVRGYALYEFAIDDNSDEATTRRKVTQLHAALGLTHADTGVISGADQLSLLEESIDATQRRFVPYSSRAMNWHTDGYYNAPEENVESFCLHCLRPAEQGGALSLFDNELLLIALYDHNPELVSLLTHPEAMFVPASHDELGHARPDRLAAVFDTGEDGHLITRFTTRKRNIQWRTPATQQAIETAIKLIDHYPDWHSQLRLQAGQGLISRNILHSRTAFENNDNATGRQILRGRYRQRPAPRI